MINKFQECLDKLETLNDPFLPNWIDPTIWVDKRDVLELMSQMFGECPLSFDEKGYVHVHSNDMFNAFLDWLVKWWRPK